MSLGRRCIGLDNIVADVTPHLLSNVKAPGVGVPEGRAIDSSYHHFPAASIMADHVSLDISVHGTRDTETAPG